MPVPYLEVDEKEIIYAIIRSSDDCYIIVTNLKIYIRYLRNSETEELELDTKDINGILWSYQLLDSNKILLEYYEQTCNSNHSSLYHLKFSLTKSELKFKPAIEKNGNIKKKFIPDNPIAILHHKNDGLHLIKKTEYYLLPKKAQDFFQNPSQVLFFKKKSSFVYYLLVEPKNRSTQGILNDFIISLIKISENESLQGQSYKKPLMEIKHVFYVSITLEKDNLKAMALYDKNIPDLNRAPKMIKLSSTGEETNITYQPLKTCQNFNVIISPGCQLLRSSEEPIEKAKTPLLQKIKDYFFNSSPKTPKINFDLESTPTVNRQPITTRPPFPKGPKF